MPSGDTGTTTEDSGADTSPADTGTTVTDSGSSTMESGVMMTMDTGSPVDSVVACRHRRMDAACVPPGIDAGSISSDVIQHHKNPNRDGVYIDPNFPMTSATGLHVETSFSLNGHIYAQPLWVSNGPNGAEAFIVATESNHVTAFSATGTTVWDESFGTPVSSGLACGGDVVPLGITGTPYIDTMASAVYFDAATTGPTDLDGSTTGPTH